MKISVDITDAIIFLESGSIYSLKFKSKFLILACSDTRLQKFTLLYYPFALKCISLQCPAQILLYYFVLLIIFNSFKITETYFLKIFPEVA